MSLLPHIDWMWNDYGPPTRDGEDGENFMVWNGVQSNPSDLPDVVRTGFVRTDQNGNG
jgi:hypothetical protein